MISRNCRAKAGGKQSGKDATGKFAKSAGSQIRRYNEVWPQSSSSLISTSTITIGAANVRTALLQAALRQEILSTLQSWRLQLEKVSRIFVAAPGGNEACLFEEASPLNRDDTRLAGIPFPTKRPTFSEAKRVMSALLTVVEPEKVFTPPPPQVRVYSVRAGHFALGCALTAE